MKNLSFAIMLIGVCVGSLYAQANPNVRAQGTIIFLPNQGLVDSLTIRGSLNYPVTTVAAGTYDLLASDLVLHVTYTGTAAVTSLTLPSAQCSATVGDGRIVIIKDAGGGAAANNITVDTEGGETIDGAATAVLNGNYDSISIYCENSNWFIF